MTKKLIKLAITGGQLAGKDTIILKLKEDLEKHGFYVIWSNEVAEYIMKHNIKPFGDEKISVLLFQDAVFKQQLFMEDLCINLAKQIETNKPIVFLINRGLLDGKAFLNYKDFDWIVNNNNYDLKK